MKFETSRGGDGALATHLAGSWPHTRRRQLSCQRLLGLLKAFFLCQRLEAATGPWPRTLNGDGPLATYAAGSWPHISTHTPQTAVLGNIGFVQGLVAVDVRSRASHGSFES
jgi:hypothetical protein